MGRFQDSILDGFLAIENELSSDTGRNYIFTYEGKAPCIITSESDDSAIQHNLNIEFNRSALCDLPKVKETVKIGVSEIMAGEWIVSSISSSPGSPIATAELAHPTNEF